MRLEYSTNVTWKWVVLVLYGITTSLFAYCVSLLVASPLAAFAAVAGYNIILFLVCADLTYLLNELTQFSFKLYLAGYLLTLTYAKTSDADRFITIIHFTVSVLSPVASVVSNRPIAKHFSYFELTDEGRVGQCQPIFFAVRWNYN